MYLKEVLVEPMWGVNLNPLKEEEKTCMHCICFCALSQIQWGGLYR